MIEYLVDGHTFILSYKELREQYILFCEMSDDEFITQLPAATHLACVICYLKEIPTYVCLSDKGIIHELVHLLHIPDGNTTTINEIRELFRQQLMLA